MQQQSQIPEEYPLWSFDPGLPFKGDRSTQRQRLLSDVKQNEEQGGQQGATRKRNIGEKSDTSPDTGMTDDSKARNEKDVELSISSMDLRSPPPKRRQTLTSISLGDADLVGLIDNEAYPAPKSELDIQSAFDEYNQYPLPSPSASPAQVLTDDEDQCSDKVEKELVEHDIVKLAESQFASLPKDPNLHKTLLWNLLARADRQTLSSLCGIISGCLKRDLISSLPSEISLRILNQLDHKSLCSASLVCKNWLDTTRKSKAGWLRLLKADMNFTEEQDAKFKKEFDSKDNLTSQYRELYRRRLLIHKRWMDPTFKPKRISVSGHGPQVVTCLQFDENKIITGAEDKLINVYETRTGKLTKILQGHDGGVWALKYYGNTLVSGSTDRTVRVWNIATGRCTHVFRGHTSTVRCLDILPPVEIGFNDKGEPLMFPEDPLLITGSRDNTLHVWKLPLADENDATPPFVRPFDVLDGINPFSVRSLRGHTASVRSLCGHGRTVISGSYDMNVRVWDLMTGQCTKVLKGHTDKIYSTVLDVKRDRCISGSMDSTIKIWDLKSGTLLATLEGHSSLVGLLDLSTNALVSAAADSSLRIWDPETGNPRHQLKGHIGAITCFQHNDSVVVSGSERMLKLWDAKSGRFVRDLLSDVTGGIWQVRFDHRRCIAAVQRRIPETEREETFIEILDFGEGIEGEQDSEGDVIM